MIITINKYCSMAFGFFGSKNPPTPPTPSAPPPAAPSISDLTAPATPPTPPPAQNTQLKEEPSFSVAPTPPPPTPLEPTTLPEEDQEPTTLTDQPTTPGNQELANETATLDFTSPDIATEQSNTLDLSAFMNEAGSSPAPAPISPPTQQLPLDDLPDIPAQLEAANQKPTLVDSVDSSFSSDTKRQVKELLEKDIADDQAAIIAQQAALDKEEADLKLEIEEIEHKEKQAAERKENIKNRREEINATRQELDSRKARIDRALSEL